MKFKMFGGILLVAGTCIGGGMLGLPIATAQSGFINSSLLFILCWMLMTFTALLTLEVNLCFPKNSHIISMAKQTLGKPGAIICWTIYLLFFYALVSAYISGGQDVLHGLLSAVNIHVPVWMCGIIFVGLFGSIVAAGIKQVDMFNRLLMILKLCSIALLIFFLSSRISIENFYKGNAWYLLPAVSVIITSFGFSVIIPSLRAYFNDDVKRLRWTIIWGSFLPLLCYIGWNAVIFGVVPFFGDHGLSRLLHLDQPISGLIDSIIYYVPTHKIIFLSRFFTSICILTAFAAVSLSLSDYLADGFNLSKEGWGKFFVSVSTFLPPLLVVIFYPRAFILFLSIAGVLCILLTALMPAMMAWSRRYVKALPSSYEVVGGKFTLLLAIVASLVVVVITIYQMLV